HGPFAWFRRRIAPVGSFIVVTEPLPDAQLNRLFVHRRAYVTSRQIGNYFRVTPDNRLLFGGQGTGSCWPQQDVNAYLLTRLNTVFPQHDGRFALDYCWSGVS
ncbi:FAD-dependent oxidoreductase, partial [Paraburkholderia sp. SIMBA_050]